MKRAIESLNLSIRKAAKEIGISHTPLPRFRLPTVARSETVPSNKGQVMNPS